MRCLSSLVTHHDMFSVVTEDLLCRNRGDPRSLSRPTNHAGGSKSTLPSLTFGDYALDETAA